MQSHVDEYLPELALGTLSGADLAAVERHLHACHRCEHELAATQDVLGNLALAIPADVVPPRALRDRILSSASAGASAGRFAVFVDTVARMMDLAGDAARKLLDMIDDATAWEAGPCDGSRLVHLAPGPAVGDALVGFVRVEPGVEFPLHRHLGDEEVLILQGALLDGDGGVARRGDIVKKPAGSEHSFKAIGDVPLVYLVVLGKGVEFPGLPGFQV